jgi:hypothetical protein
LSVFSDDDHAFADKGRYLCTVGTFGQVGDPYVSWRGLFGLAWQLEPQDYRHQDEENQRAIHDLALRWGHAVNVRLARDASAIV